MSNPQPPCSDWFLQEDTRLKKVPKRNREKILVAGLDIQPTPDAVKNAFSTRHNFHKSVACKTPHFLFTDALHRNYFLRSVYTVKFSAARAALFVWSERQQKDWSTCLPVAVVHNNRLRHPTRCTAPSLAIDIVC
jgi:hypothetical protein